MVGKFLLWDGEEKRGREEGKRKRRQGRGIEETGPYESAQAPVWVGKRETE